MESNEIKGKIRDIEHDLISLFFDNVDIVDGYFYYERQRVDNIQGLEINIYPNDHGYPHFHILAENPKIKCKIKISDFSIIEGDLPSKYYKKLLKWYSTELKTNQINKTGKERLEEIWNLYQSQR